MVNAEMWRVVRRLVFEAMVSIVSMVVASFALGFGVAIIVYSREPEPVPEMQFWAFEAEHHFSEAKYLLTPRGPTPWTPRLRDHDDERCMDVAVRMVRECEARRGR